MAFLPYASTVPFSPATSSSCYRKIISSTTSTYVYSKPVTASQYRNAYFGQQQLVTGLRIGERTEPGMWLCLKTPQRVRWNSYSNEKKNIFRPVITNMNDKQIH